ncbi:MAG TPA: hypothetical protein PLK13_16645, partial [Xanthobacteraceae bacterium]|nr:hypothetical protein [Xanthobacteraceae bacterium]
HRRSGARRLRPAQDLRVSAMAEHSSNEAFSTLERMVRGMRIAMKPGKLLYSSRDSLKRGDLYVLGFNPGGDPNVERENVLEDLLRTPSSQWNEYINGSWRLRSKTYLAGQQPRQLRIRSFFSEIDCNLSKIFCSNLFFFRSKSISSAMLDHNFETLARESAHIHTYMLSTVKPKTIICFGSSTYNWFKRLRLHETPYPVQLIQAPHFAARISEKAFLTRAREINNSICNNG